MLKRSSNNDLDDQPLPAAFGRLCVETREIIGNRLAELPAAFGRLCVETIKLKDLGEDEKTSRLRAAVC